MPKSGIRFNPDKVSREMVHQLTKVLGEFISSSLPIQAGDLGYVSPKYHEFEVNDGDPLDVTTNDLRIAVRAYYDEAREAHLERWAETLARKIRVFLDEYYEKKAEIKAYVEIELIEYVAYKKI